MIRPGSRPPTFSNDEVKLSARSLIAQDALIEPRSFRPTIDDGDRTLVGDANGLPRTVGGAAVHADMKYPRFRPTDFQLGTLLGAIPGAAFADWPVDYATLERFYVEIEHAVGVQGPEGGAGDPFAPAKSKPYPMPPGLPMYANTILAEAARRLGYHPFAYPTAVASRPYRGRPACIDCGFCSGYGCPTHAKSSPAVTLLREALLTGNVQLRFNSAVMRLVANSTRTQIAAVEYVDPAGAMQRVSADRYVLAASAAESARLVLLSDSALGNSSGLVGRNLMFHFQTQVIGILRDRVHGHRGRSVTMGMSDFRGTPGDPNAPLGGIIEYATSSDLIGEAKNYALQLGKTGDPLRKLMIQIAAARQAARDDHAGRGRATADEPRRSRSRASRCLRQARAARDLQEPSVRAHRARLLRAEAARDPGERRRSVRDRRAAGCALAVAPRDGHDADGQ